MYPNFQKYLRFQAYQFRALPFRIVTAPLEFTQVVKEVKFIALSQGVRIHQYLEDWLVRARDQESCSRDVQKLLTLIKNWGDSQFKKKTELKPTQPSTGFGLPESKEISETQNSGSFNFAGSHYYSKEAHVSN